MSCNVGNMNEKILILKEVSTRSAVNGSWTNTWTTLVTIWAARLEESSKESILKDKMTLDTNIRFQIRYRTDIKPNYRVRYRSEDYRIIGIKETERKTLQEITISILD